MDKSHYFDLMRETSEEALPLIRGQIDSLSEVDPELHASMRYVLDRRDNGLMLKPFLVRLAYEICGGSDWRKTAAVGAAFELLNISSYQANASFDNKLAVLTVTEKNSQFIASMITRELCGECVRDAVSDSGHTISRALSTDLSESNKHIYIAQHYDLNLLTASRLQFYRDKDVFLREYTSRCSHGSGVFSGRCARAGALLADATSTATAALQTFGEVFGTGLHFMNDLGDFVPPGTPGGIGRSFQDQLSDIKNGRLTLGCYLLLTSADTDGARLLRLIKDGDSSKETLDGLMTYINKSGIVSRIRKLGEEYAKRAKRALSIFEESEAKSLLCVMTSACHHNAYIRALTHHGLPPEGGVR